MKSINVVAAVIKKDNMIFATQRGYGEFIGGWEFPGGKVEAGETEHQALIREIKEELNTQISVNKYLDTIEYDYPTFHLSMKCYLCSVVSGHLDLLEASDSRWLNINTIDSVNWLPADLLLIDTIKKILE